MKSKLLLIAASLFMTGSLYAQDAPVRTSGTTAPAGQTQTQQRTRTVDPKVTQERNNTRAKELAEKLKLTEAQQKQLAKIFNDRSEKMTKMRQENSNNQQTPEQMRASMTKLRNESDSLIKKCLGVEKFKEYNKLQQQSVQGARQRPQGQGGQGQRPQGQGQNQGQNQGQRPQQGQNGNFQGVRSF